MWWPTEQEHDNNGNPLGGQAALCCLHALQMPIALLMLWEFPFAELLAENNRLNLVPKIAETFEEIIASARGQVKAIITTAEVSTATEEAPLRLHGMASGYPI